MITNNLKQQLKWLSITAIACVSLAAGGADVPKNYWSVNGNHMSFASTDLAIEAELPAGFYSLKIRDQEFIQGGKGYGGMAFRKPDGSYVTAFTSVDNIAHDASMGRKGAVADGMFLLNCITGWTLPSFEFYAGFNDPADHDLVMFLANDVRALRLTRPGSAISSSRQMVTPGAAPGTVLKGNEVAVVHDSGMVLRIAMPTGLAAAVVAAPDGTPRLAVVIPCKGMAANTIKCQYDTSNGSDALTIFPRFKVASPTMGANDPGYNPNGGSGAWALYEKGAELDYEVTFGWLGSKPFPGKVVVEARHALGQEDFRITGQPERTDEANGVSQYRAVLHPTFSLPGVSDVNVFLMDDQDIVLMIERLRIMYDWQNFKPTFNAQPDMQAFWDDTLAELATVPLDPKVEATLFKDDPDWEFQHVSFTGWQGKRIHACLYIPKNGKRPLPVTITAHPGTLGFGANHRADGVFGSKIKADPRFVTIVPLIRGHEPDAKDIPFNQPWWGPLDNRDDYVARSWYCAMVRALDYLATRPDVADMTKVVAKGGSQGGALALVTAALDPRVKVCSADCPSNCMHNNVLQPGSYPTFGPSVGQVPPGQTLDDLRTTLSYYDPANLAPRITCPTVIAVCVGDLTVHSMGGLGVSKNLTSLPPDQNWFCPGVNGHYHAGSAAGTQKTKELIEALLAEPK